MLQSIRGTAGSWVVKILFVLLIISFAVWGIGDVSRGVQGGVAEVGDVTLTPQDLSQEYRSELNRLRRVLGPEFTDEQARQLGLVDRALEQLIQRTLLAESAQDMGLRVGDQRVVDEVRDFQAFQNGLGQFDPNVMRAVLAQNDLTEQGFVEQMRADIARSTVAGMVSAGAAAPLPLTEALYRFRNERRVLELVTVPAAAMPAPAAPDEATLAKFHQDKAVRYTAPEYRSLLVASLNADALADEVTVTDEQIREAYDTRRSEFVTPERRDIVQGVFPDQAAAEKAAAAVMAGTSIEDAAKASGVEAVALEDVAREDLPAELQDAAFSTAQGATAAPVQSAFGWHVLTVRDVTAGGERSFEEVKDQIAQELRREQAMDRLFDVSNTMDETLAGGASLEEAAQKVGATVTKIEKTDNQGRTPDGRPVEGVRALDQVLQAAFALPAGETSPMTEAGDAGYFAVQVAGVEPAALRPMEQVRPQVLADWTAEQRAEAAKAKGAEIAAALKAGTPVEQAAKSVPGATYAKSEPLLRNPGRGAPVPPAVLEELFAAQPGAVASGDAQGGFVVGKLAEVIPADPAASAGQIEQIRNETAETVGSDLVAQYLNGLRGRYSVSVNRGAVDQLFRAQE